jgi:archaemetzincin
MLWVASEVEDLEMIEEIIRALHEVYGLEVGYSMIKLEGAERFYDPHRRQYHAGGIISLLKPEKDKLTLIITSRDLYIPGLNYVFGYAPGGVGVVSTKRLDPRFYGGSYDRRLFLERAVKEAVHEIGHLMGLGHCPNHDCVMHFSNNILDTDRKSSQLCGDCRRRL